MNGIRTRKRPTPAESSRALAEVRELFKPTPYMLAQARFDRAKAEYTAAAEALLRQEVGAAEQADMALAKFNAACDELRRLDAAQS